MTSDEELADQALAIGNNVTLRAGNHTLHAPALREQVLKAIRQARREGFDEAKGNTTTAYEQGFRQGALAMRERAANIVEGAEDDDNVTLGTAAYCLKLGGRIRALEAKP